MFLGYITCELCNKTFDGAVYRAQSCDANFQCHCQCDPWLTSFNFSDEIIIMNLESNPVQLLRC